MEYGSERLENLFKLRFHPQSSSLVPRSCQLVPVASSGGIWEWLHGCLLTSFPG